MSRQPIQKRREPAFIEPMQCNPVSALPSGEKWTFEIEFDGYLSIAVKLGSEVTLSLATRKCSRGSFPASSRRSHRWGIISLSTENLLPSIRQGKPSFQILQNNLSRTLPVYFYAFDLLNSDGETLVSFPIESRRDLLARMLPTPEDPLRLSPLLQAPTGQILEAVRKLGLEGVVGKRIGSIYEPGERSGAWIKHRANMEQEFVIGGYVPGARGFDALLVGVYESKQLMFAGKVKNGFVPRIRDELFPSLKALQIAHSAPLRIFQRKGPPDGENRLPQRKWSNADGLNRNSFAKSLSSNGRMPGT